MKNVLRTVIQREGIAIISQTEDFQRVLQQEGYSTQKLYALLLILNACPSVSELVKSKQLSNNETQTLISTAVRATGLTAETVRELLAELVEACGIKCSRRVEIPKFKKGLRGLELPETEEEQQVILLSEDLALGENASDLTLGTLENYAKNGSAKACYVLGMHYHDKDIKNNTDFGVPYFERAASLGFGPANGALADYYLNGKKKKLRLAASLFQHPSSIAGKSGRRWADNAEQLLTYRGENMKRAVWFLAMSGATLMVALLALAVLPALYADIALVCGVLALSYTLFSMVFFPFNSYRIVNLALLLSWVVLEIGLLL